MIISSNCCKEEENVPTPDTNCWDLTPHSGGTADLLLASDQGCCPKNFSHPDLITPPSPDTSTGTTWWSSSSIPNIDNINTNGGPGEDDARRQEEACATDIDVAPALHIFQHSTPDSSSTNFTAQELSLLFQSSTAFQQQYLTAQENPCSPTSSPLINSSQQQQLPQSLKREDFPERGLFPAPTPSPNCGGGGAFLTFHSSNGVIPLTLDNPEMFTRVPLGEKGRMELKAAIRGALKDRPELRERVNAVAKLRCATIPQLLRIAGICGLWYLALNISRKFMEARNVKHQGRSTRARKVELGSSGDFSEIEGRKVIKTYSKHVPRSACGTPLVNQSAATSMVASSSLSCKDAAAPPGTPPITNPACLLSEDWAAPPGLNPGMPTPTSECWDQAQGWTAFDVGGACLDTAGGGTGAGGASGRNTVATGFEFGRCELKDRGNNVVAGAAPPDYWTAADLLGLGGAAVAETKRSSWQGY